MGFSQNERHKSEKGNWGKLYHHNWFSIRSQTMYLVSFFFLGSPCVTKCIVWKYVVKFQLILKSPYCEPWTDVIWWKVLH